MAKRRSKPHCKLIKMKITRKQVHDFQVLKNHIFTPVLKTTHQKKQLKFIG
ncbi:hypothetical protein HMPREF0765_2219 [Sphingobacterium spiritivorum ATCC 33300]|uniref:Uncharacterized protein n=1 Tax=Sphingobacterium spiritivorum ATCC 33300 TaxID=525372 RepID=C2FY13_SPHSI|nr:hypothetical protein HMPREF0765_2219 [Sphingobacterium spiritivorum ATCC 33300]